VRLGLARQGAARLGPARQGRRGEARLGKATQTTNNSIETKDKKKMTTKSLTISAPNFQTAEFRIRGNAPYVQNKFSHKARITMKETQEAGSTSRKGKKKEPKNFHDNFKQSQHVSPDGWYGIPAPAFRAAMVSACKIAGFAMTRAKLSVFVEADGFDADDQTPLVRITKGEPEYAEHIVRIQMTTDIRARAMWRPGWEAVVRVKFDADQFTLTDVANLLMRVGMQVGVGEGRPDSKTSTGMGWGTFDVVSE
jgi:hypothetical protein